MLVTRHRTHSGRFMEIIHKRKIRLIVNAIPLMYVTTGVGRYLRCLYEPLERLYGHKLEISYFDGKKILKRPPQGPADLNRWSRQTELFWKLPFPVALCIRMGLHFQGEALFRIAARGHDLYHEAAFFPFIPPSGLKTIFTIHDLSLLRFPQFHPKERVLFFRLFFRRRARKADSFLSVSAFTRSEVMKFLGLKEDKITVTPLAHDPRTFYPRSLQEVDKIRRRFTLPDQYFLFVGSGDPRKNIRVIPEALERAKIRIPLVIAGWSGWGQEEGQHGGVLSLGYASDEDLACLYSGALALVYPSLYEGFGLPVLEAMACGCPVICSRRASLPEVADNAALYLEDPSDPSELACLFREVVSNPKGCQVFAERGPIRASSFSWEKTARKTFKAFREILYK